MHSPYEIVAGCSGLPVPEPVHSVLPVLEIALPPHSLGPQLSLSRREPVLDSVQDSAEFHNRVVCHIAPVNRDRPTLLQLSNPSCPPGIGLAETESSLDNQEFCYRLA